jgi:DNA mismatch repair ATPase MutS
VSSSGRHASAEIGRLSQLTALLSSRHNVIFAIPAGLVMWATQWACAIEAWRSRAGVHIPDWLDVVGEFEALLALATFAAEHPDDCVFPEIVDAGSTLIAEELAHPTLPPDAVGNPVALANGHGPSLLIVSGSNMSGKSTLLRTLGVNVVLAQMGAPVRARLFRLSALDVGAAIRVQDSLVDGRSRFMAEITRLKEIVDLTARRNGAVLFLLDEILGGTNSHDRRIGSEALLAGLVTAGAIGLVTTHDLALGEIAARLPGRAENVHFEDRFENGQLAFDYRLRPGIVQTSNAIALMRSIGLDV